MQNRLERKIMKITEPASSPITESRTLRPRQRETKLLTSRQRFLNACRCEPVDHPPVWLMRQAGRALPEYRHLKERHSFLELVRTPELAAEITMQPVRRFGFDAAILFSDILVVPEALGQAYCMRDEGGIKMEPALFSGEDIRQLDTSRVPERLAYARRALELIKPHTANDTALLGFAGSPWTLANFMLEGGSAKDFRKAKQLFYLNRNLFDQLCDKLAEAVTEFLQMQIDAGADAVQIFDSLGGLLPPSIFDAASGRWIRQIIAELNHRVPVIVFSKGTHGSWETLVSTGADVLSVDCSVRLETVNACLPPTIGIQGNLDPCVLNTTPPVAAAETKRVLKELAGRNGHIFNLGHGVPPSARIENIEAVVQTVRAGL
jgi:uroporphyrinogen decarboxylase